MTKKRYTHIDLHYMGFNEVLELINELSVENEKLKLKVNGLKSELIIWKEDANEHIQETNKLFEENKQLKKEKEFWKGNACNCSNYLSILSMDCQIVQEAICDLKNVIDVDTEASKLLDELDDKFDDLNQHRIKMYSRGF